MNYLLIIGPISNFAPEEINDKLNQIWQTKVINKKGKSYLFFSTSMDSVSTSDEKISLIEGYFSNESSNNKIGSLEKLLTSKTWPLPESTTGSFSYIQHNPHGTIIANDLLGIYPVYYKFDQIEGMPILFLSNTILAFSILPRIEFDYTGLFQRRFTHHNYTYGSRTILKNVKRLLPGEYKNINIKQKNRESSLFDDSLYKLEGKNQNLPFSDIAHNYYEFVKSEYEIALQDYESVVFGLSGGMDSRLMVGLLPEKINKHAITYGTNENEYEVKLAKRVAGKLENSSFTFFNVISSHFPAGTIFKHLVKNTESVYVNNWLPILHNPILPLGQPFLLGDMCEVIPGKFLGNYSSRSKKIKTYLGGGNFTIANKETQRNWFDETLQKEFFHFPKEAEFDYWGQSYNNLLEETRNDINELFNIINLHSPNFIEMYDELFNWFTYIRITHAKQFLIFKNHYKPISPALSFRNLRESTSIHPGLRINYRLMSEMFKSEDSLRRLGSIPSAQIPFLSLNSPTAIRLFFWGVRSTIDQLLIKRMMRSKNSKLRYRLVESLNWPLIYQQEDAYNNLRSCLDEDHVYCSNILDTFLKRRNLETWPLVNFGIFNILSLNEELATIKRYT